MNSPLSRAEFLRLIALGLPAWTTGGVPPAWAQSTPDHRRRISELIQAYDNQGIHRTATIVDNASADWLRQLATVAGAEVRLSPFDLQRIDIRAAYVEVDGIRIQGVPCFDGSFTNDTGFVGTLGTPESSAEVAVVTTNGTAGAGLEKLRRSATHRAIVAVTVTETPGLRLANAEAFASPYGLPVLQVGSEHESSLTALAAAGRRATFVAAANRTPAQAINVVATVAGRQPELPPLAVVTPRSGWWRCASERGGGLACWMEAIRAVSAARPVRPAIFVASSGHELGYFGFDAFLEERPSLATDAVRWIHLGANIGAAGGQVRLQASDDETEAELARALSESGAPVRQRVPRGTVPAGEASNIHLAGGRYVSLLGAGPGANRFFHMQEDRWPAAVDLDAVTRYATAVSTLAVSLVTRA